LPTSSNLLRRYRNWSVDGHQGEQTEIAVARDLSVERVGIDMMIFRTPKSVIAEDQHSSDCVCALVTAAEAEMVTLDLEIPQW